MNICKCECEHISHLERDKRSPNGNPTHKYGVEYNVNYTLLVKTPYGTYRVCKDCAIDCMYELAVKE